MQPRSRPLRPETAPLHYGLPASLGRLPGRVQRVGMVHWRVRAQVPHRVGGMFGEDLLGRGVPRYEC